MLDAKPGPRYPVDMSEPPKPVIITVTPEQARRARLEPGRPIRGRVLEDGRIELCGVRYTLDELLDQCADDPASDSPPDRVE